MKTKRQFILDTLLPYKQNPETCGYSVGECVYLADNGNMCAVGKHMKEGEWQYSVDSADNLFMEYEKKEVLTKEAYEQNLSDLEWNKIQNVHDYIANEDDFSLINRRIEQLENETNLKFPELYYEV